MLQVVHDLTNRRKVDNISQSWKEVILPDIVCQHVLACHDYPLNTYAQRAICSSAKQLSNLYSYHHQQEASHLPKPPKIIPPESSFYPLALEATLSLKATMATHAFPKHIKPQSKHRDQVLRAVMGNDFTSEELKKAYQNQDGQGTGKGGCGGGGGGGGNKNKNKKKGKGKGGKGPWNNNKDQDNQEKKEH